MSDALLMQRPGLSIRYVDLEAIILDREADVVHQLNPSASYIWSRFDGNTSIDDIIQSLVDDFQLDVAAATQEVTELVEQLSQHNLLVTGTDTNSPSE